MTKEKNDEIRINKKTILIGAAALVVAFFGIIGGLALNSQNAQGNDAAKVANYVGETQEVTLSYDWDKYEYVMEPSTLQKGVKARVTVDLDSVSGCMRDIVIDEFNVRKLVSQGNNVFEFIPDKAGTFKIHCSMYMGIGEFKVVDESGSTGTYTEKLSASGSAASCGGSGGCGCGMKPNLG